MEISFDELFLAYLTCRSNKRRTTNSIKFELNLEENLFQLYDDLLNDNYRIGRFIYFVLTKPKYREVWASDFRDRIVHHFIYNRMIDYYYPRFIHDTYACIPNRGTDAAFCRMVKFIRAESQNYSIPTYVLKLDIKNFFINIDRIILWNVIKDNSIIQNILPLAYQIIFHNPLENYSFRGDPNLIELVPPHKRLSNAKINCGLPIGNLTSQFFANIYLDQLDQYCKRELKIKKYVRYVDDIVIISSQKEKLKDYIIVMQSFIKEKLNLEFHSDKILISNINQGVDFVGKIAYPYYNKTRKTTVNSLNKVLQNQQKFDYDYFQSAINSYFGFLRQTNSFNVRKQIAKKYNNLKFDNDFTKLIK